MIELRYKCGCMRQEITLMVRERAPREDIINWMDFVVRPALSIDHNKRSPLCRSAEVEYLKVPVEDEKPIGVGKTRHLRAAIDDFKKKAAKPARPRVKMKQAPRRYRK